MSRPTHGSLSLSIRRGLILVAVFMLALTLTSCLPNQLSGEGPPPGLITGNIPANYQGATPPFSLTDQGTIQAGQGVYQRAGLNCASCHGTDGRGNGQFSTAMDFIPANFAEPVMQSAFRDHQDYVFWWVSEGVPPTPMPAWKDVLSDIERWQAIAYSWWVGQQPIVSPPPVTGSGEGSQGSDMQSRLRRYMNRR